MDFKAVVTDLDGTLCDDRKIHPRDKKAVSKVLELGIPVIPATTRMRFSSSMILEDLEIDKYPLICNNGARVLGGGWKDYSGTEDWYNAFLDREIAEELAVYTDEKGYEMTTVFKEKKFWKRREDETYDKIGPITDLVDKNVNALDEGSPVSFMMHSEKNGLEGLKDFESFASDFSDILRLDRHHRSGKFLALTVYRDGVSKRNALELICEETGISMDDVLAIGDDEVDIGMLRCAGMGIAMCNSPEHVKKAADEVAPSCEEQGVSKILEKYLIDH